MSKEYVDKELAEQAMLDLHVKVDDDGYVWALRRDAFCAVNDLPAANVRENVVGKWEPAMRFCPICGEDKFKGLDADIWADWTPPFCPNCGASMESCY